MTPLAPQLSAFFYQRLPSEQGCSGKTIQTYLYCFQLLVRFGAKRLRCRPSDLSVEQLDAPLIMAFLEHLESDRGNCARTRNARLAAIKSFMHFLEYRLPAALAQIQQVLAIPTKRTDEPLVGYLDPTEAEALLDAPSLTTARGLRDRAMLVLGSDLGLRVSEIVGLKLGDVELGHAKQVTVTGKGRRQRCLPLTSRATKAMREWLAARGAAPAPEVFLAQHGGPMTPRNFQLMVAKYHAQAESKQPSLEKKHVTPHVLRHTCAMSILAATSNIAKVALWLGHASVHTTETYTRADPTVKLEVVNARTLPQLRRGTFKPPDALLALLSPTTAPV